MKKLLALSLAGALTCALAISAPQPAQASAAYYKVRGQLSKLSFSELLRLRDAIDAALWQSPDWQEVTVPAGTYQIGKDIPAGRWSIRIAGDPAMDTAYYFQLPDAGGSKPNYAYSVTDLTLVSSSITEEYPSLPAQQDLDMVAGWYYYCSSTTIFTPSAGPSLGFR